MKCYEELEFVLHNPKLAFKQGYKSHGFEGTKHVFVEKCTDKSSLVLHEGQGMGWFSIQEIEDLKIIGHDKETYL